MTVTKFYCNEIYETADKLDINDQTCKLLLEGNILCNDATLSDDTKTGDPTEIALLEIGYKYNVVKDELSILHPRVEEIPFDSDRKLIMLATTGQTEDEKAAITAAADKIPLFRAANMSLGIATLVSLVKTAVCMFPDADIEIIEKHHNQKLDVPSGTALALADAVKAVREEAEFVVGRHENGKRRKEEVGIHSLRLGGVVGEHEVIITTGNETISLKHEAHSRAVFADGGVMAAAYVAAQTVPGLYTMEDLVAACR